MRINLYAVGRTATNRYYVYSRDDGVQHTISFEGRINATQVMLDWNGNPTTSDVQRYEELIKAHPEFSA